VDKPITDQSSGGLNAVLSLKDLLASQRFKQLAWLIESFEGFKGTIYRDIGGRSTVGYGHEIIGSVEKDAELKYLGLSLESLSKGLTQEGAYKLLAYDVFDRANIQRDLKMPLEDNVWIALTSFCFNIGLGNFEKSKVLKLLPALNFYQIADSLSSWRECNDKFSVGLAKRRLIEVLVLLQKPLDANSSLLPSQQLKAPSKMPFTDENWVRLSQALRKGVSDAYALHTKAFPVST
jgi:lysozyme